TKSGGPLTESFILTDSGGGLHPASVIATKVAAHRTKRHGRLMGRGWEDAWKPKRFPAGASCWIDRLSVGLCCPIAGPSQNKTRRRLPRRQDLRTAPS